MRHGRLSTMKRMDTGNFVSCVPGTPTWSESYDFVWDKCAAKASKQKWKEQHHRQLIAGKRSLLPLVLNLQ